MYPDCRNIAPVPSLKFYRPKLASWCLFFSCWHCTSILDSSNSKNLGKDLELCRYRRYNNTHHNLDNYKISRQSNKWKGASCKFNRSSDRSVSNSFHSPMCCHDRKRYKNKRSKQEAMICKVGIFIDSKNL
jgi:hypothetical protein